MFSIDHTRVEHRARNNTPHEKHFESARPAGQGQAPEELVEERKLLVKIFGERHDAKMVVARAKNVPHALLQGGLRAAILGVKGCAVPILVHLLPPRPSMQKERVSQRMALAFRRNQPIAAARTPGLGVKARLLAAHLQNVVPVPAYRSPEYKHKCSCGQDDAKPGEAAA